MQTDKKTSALNRLKTVRPPRRSDRHSSTRSATAPEIMKQVSALQGSLEKVNRVLS